MVNSPLVYLHIGRGKTGTTAIQRFCSDQHEWLAARGVHYVEAGDDRRGVGHQAFAQSFLPSVPDWMAPAYKVERIQDDVRAELAAAPATTFLISSENLTLVDPRPVREYFERQFGEVRFKIIFFARSQDELAESQYNQIVKWSGRTDTFDTFIAGTALDELEFDALLEPWAREFGEEAIVAKVYDASGPSVIPDFLSCVSPGMEAPPADRGAGPVNPSVGYLTLEIYRFLNQFDLEHRRKLYPSIHALLASSDAPALYFTSAAAEAYRRRFAESNLRFSQRFLGQAVRDLGGRKHSDEERDAIMAGRPAQRT